MTTPYLTADDFKDQALIPSTYVDELELEEPGWVLKRLTRHSAWINARLAKRYAAPFASPYPEAVVGWLEALTTNDVLLRRGVSPTDDQFQEIKGAALAARTDVLEAADSENGMFELPLRADLSTSGVALGGPFSYSEASPYAFTDRQRLTGVDEDQNGGGTYG